MSKVALEHLNNYLEGWKQGDGRKSLQSTVPEFYYDDPNSCRISRENFVQFVEDFKTAAADLSDGEIPQPFLVYSHELVDNGLAWCWWKVSGTTFEGSAVITFNDRGVTSEKIAYFSKLPE